MAFNNFTLQSAQEQFGLNLKTNEPLFPGVHPVDAGPAVHSTLETLGQLALSVNTEKARLRVADRSLTRRAVDLCPKHDLPSIRGGFHRR